MVDAEETTVELLCVFDHPVFLGDSREVRVPTTNVLPEGVLLVEEGRSEFEYIVGIGETSRNSLKK